MFYTEIIVPPYVSCYYVPMPQSRRPCSSDRLRVKIGQWFEADASGWGVAATVGLVALLLGPVLGRMLLA